MEEAAQSCDLCERTVIDLYSIVAYYTPGNPLDREYHFPSQRELSRAHPPFLRNASDFSPDCAPCQVIWSAVNRSAHGSPVRVVQLVATEPDEESTRDLLMGYAKAPLRNTAYWLGTPKYFPTSQLEVLPWHCDEEPGTPVKPGAYSLGAVRYLRMFAEPGCSSSLQRHISGHAISVPSSDLNVSRIKKWLQSCRKLHSRCRKGISGITLNDRKPDGAKNLPSRVIDVGLSFGSPVRLVVSDSSRGYYCALSYCWAPKSSTYYQNTLLGTTIDQFKERIPLGLLPKPIKDAIEVTRRIGVPYLWVDRLCIIQDNEDDIQKECDRMCDIYEQALLTIAALGDDTGEKGLFLDREVLDHPASHRTITTGSRPPWHAKLPCTLKGKPLGDIYIARFPGTEPSGGGSTEGCFDRELRQSRWITRGWIFQERMLSRRIVYFGKHQIYWECQKEFWNEDGSPDVPSLTHTETNGVLKRSFVGNLMVDDIGEKFGDAADIHEHWMDVVGHYSGRNLTVATDRLRAISGVAQALGRRFSQENNYHFGIWIESLSEELAWYMDETTRDSTIYGIAPSWSWAAQSGQAKYFPRVPDIGKGWLSLGRAHLKFLYPGDVLPVLQVQAVLVEVQTNLAQKSKDESLAEWLRDITSDMNNLSFRPWLGDGIGGNRRPLYDATITIGGRLAGIARYDNDPADGSGSGSACLLLSYVDESEDKKPPVYWFHMMLLERVDRGEAEARPTFRRVGAVEGAWLEERDLGFAFHRQPTLEIDLV